MRRPRRSSLAALSVALMIVLATLSCEQVVVNTIAVHRLDIVPAEAAVRVDETLPLTVTALSRDGRTLSGRTIAWSSLNPEIATVDESGVVRGVTRGSASIQAASEGARATASVTVTTGPVIAAAPQEVEFVAVQSGATPGDRTVNVTNAGDGTLSGLSATIAYGPGESSGWLTASMSGTAPTTLVLSANHAGLSPDTYTATVTVAAAVANNTPVHVTVRLVVLAPPPAIALGATTVDLATGPGGADPAPQNVAVTNAGGGVLTELTAAVSYTGDPPSTWLTATLESASAPTTLALRAVAGSLPPGVYTAIVQVSSAVAQNSPQTVTVNFSVSAPQPSIGAAPRIVDFIASKGGANPPAQTVQLTNTGGGSLTGLGIAVTYDEPRASWLTTSLSGTSAPATITLSAVTGSLDVGTYDARVRIAAPGASNTPVDILVTFTIAAVPPAPAGSLAASAVSDRRINVSWRDQSDNEARFDIERSADGATGWTVIGTTGTNQESYADSTGLAGSTTYHYRISACNAVGCSRNPTAAAATTAPSAPTNLTANAAISSQVDLTWNDNSPDETGFPVERSSNSGQTWSAIGTAAAGAQSFRDTGATPGTAYRYRVRACRNALCSRFSSEAQVTTPTIPAAPSALVATAASPTQIDLNWTDNSTNETEFRIESRTASGTYAQVGTTAANTRSFAHTALNAKTQYFYRVRACTAAECSSYSTEASATTPPNAPTSLTASAPSHARVELSWKAPPEPVTSYRVERRVATAAFTPLASVTGGNTTTYVDTDVQEKTAYTYRVRACDNTLCSAFSNTAPVTTPAAPVEPPGAPASLDARSVSSSRIDITWSAATGSVQRYYIERKTTPPGTYAVIDSAGAGSRSYQNTGLLPSTGYWYRVRACNTGGCSEYSPEAAATTPLPPPGAPSQLSATAASPNRIDLAWTASSGTVSRYRIERKNNTLLGSYAVIDSVPGGTLTYQSNGLTAAMSYSHRVQACSDGGCSAYSNEATVSTPVLSVVTSPTDLVATPSSATQVDLSWQYALLLGSVEIDHALLQGSFEIERALGSSSNFTRIQTVSGATRSYRDTGLTGGTTYYYRVRACTPTECSAWSDVASGRTHAPATPTNIAAIATSASRVTLSWTAPAGVAFYQIRRREDGKGRPTFLMVSDPAATTFSDSELSSTTRYTYEIQACGSENNICSSYSPEVAVTTF